MNGMIFAQSVGFAERIVDPFLGIGFAVNFLVLGSLYSLIAVGFVIIFKSTQVLNFSHGAIAALGAYFTWTFVSYWNIPGRFFAPDSAFNMANTESFWQPRLLTWVVAVILAALMAAALGWVLERIFIEPMVGEPLFSVAIITLGMEIVLRTIYTDLLGSLARPMGDPFGFNGWTLEIGERKLLVFWSQPFIVATTIVLAIGLVLFFRSKYGIAMRATAFDQEAAMIQGIPVRKIFALAWVIGGLLAAFAGTFSATAPPRFRGADSALSLLAFRALPAVVVGGLDSIIGAFVGGFIVAFAEIFLPTYFTGLSDVVGKGYEVAIPYTVMFLFLIIKPYGLFGTEEIRRV